MALSVTRDPFLATALAWGVPEHMVEAFVSGGTMKDTQGGGPMHGGKHIKHMDGKWRIMDKSGSAILRAGNKPGNKPADGGGFDTYEEALRFFRGMERSMHGG